MCPRVMRPHGRSAGAVTIFLPVVYAVVPLPRSADPRAEVERWMLSAPMRDLVGAFGGELPGGDPRGVIAWLEDCSRRWAYREGRWSRAEARRRTRQLRFTDEQHEQIRASATALGLVAAEQPAESDYHHVLVLGSYLDTCVARAERAA